MIDRGAVVVIDRRADVVIDGGAEVAMGDGLRSLCVFAGSSAGHDPAHRRCASALGHALAEAGIRIVYGGGGRGLMGALADAALSSGGQVHGVIPRSMVEREWAHPGVTHMHVTDDMHERKALMAQLSDAFVALPGGIGTLEELFEVFTWAQLRFHHKPLALLDNDGFYRPLLDLLDHLVEQGFVGAEAVGLLRIEADPKRLIASLDEAVMRAV